MSAQAFRSTRRILPLEQWPEADRKAWSWATRLSTPFEEAGAAAHLRPASRLIREQAYGSWLGFLQANELIRPEQDPAQRVTPEQLRAFVETLQGQVNPLSVWSKIASLRLAVRAMAPAAACGTEEAGETAVPRSGRERHSGE